ncbi:hypothetical protein REPUB_Repub10bG0139100 [Reevesia pubescens]
MGQSPSAALDRENSLSVSDRFSVLSSSGFISSEEFPDEIATNLDYTAEIPDECLAYVFQFLGPGDRNRCSRVCKRWLRVDGWSRHRLSLNAQSEILASLPSLFTRFDSVTKLALRCSRKSISLNDEAFVTISIRCQNLTRLKLRGCREISDEGMSAFAQNSKNLKKLSCGSCVFGAKALNSVLDYCKKLEELSVKRLRGIHDGAEPIGPGAAASSLKMICLKELVNECSDYGLACIAENCKFLRKLHVDGWRTNRIGDEGLVAVAKYCPNLEELVLIGVNATHLSLSAIAGNCSKLERLALCGSGTIGDTEIACIAAKCTSLKKLCIKGCPISDISIEALASGCPSLMKIKVRKCRGVSGDAGEWLHEQRGSMVINMDACDIDGGFEASVFDGGFHENGVEFPQAIGQVTGADASTSSNGRLALLRSKLGLFTGRNLVACTFRRWSNSDDSFNSNL